MNTCRVLSFIALLLLLSVSHLVAEGPDYGCEASNQACVEQCDNAADTGKGANAYNSCLEGCRKSNESCTSRQKAANACAKSFKSCISSAAGNEDALEGCRAAYRACKGE
ncbi:MAG TPA: hypothetical protein DEA96_18110 [Leptospiraceae bacterium]|nr:hypothetical protein [Spirochaetaceae bacterium]HBS06890.1 hypothetical protein [Leptospiraceae bacterium]|tara:strand:- start:29963 stop:30292 length:330 start_codon:yes stop_codon:yes gene_type:complete